MREVLTSKNVCTASKPIARRPYLKSVGLVAAGMVGLAGCLGNDTGTLRSYVTDQPGDIADFESCVAHIVGMWLGPEEADPGDEDSDPGGRERYDFDEAQFADLVELQDGETQLIDERELDSATYAFLQLDIDEMDATLTNGETATVEMPGQAPLTFNQDFEIREGTTTRFTADFVPVQRGATGEYVLQPVPEKIDVTYDDEDA